MLFWCTSQTRPGAPLPDQCTILGFCECWLLKSYRCPPSPKTAVCWQETVCSQKRPRTCEWQYSRRQDWLPCYFIFTLPSSWTNPFVPPPTWASPILENLTENLPSQAEASPIYFLLTSAFFHDVTMLQLSVYPLNWLFFDTSIWFTLEFLLSKALPDS